jgi:hypothetical protein
LREEREAIKIERRIKFFGNKLVQCCIRSL